MWVRVYCTLQYLISIRVWGIASFYLTWVLLQPLMSKTKQPHTFFLYKSVIRGWWHNDKCMDELEQNITDFISKVPKGCIFDAHSVISYLLKTHSDDYLDFHNDAEPTNSFHSRVSRAINPFADKNVIERIDAKSYSLNIRGNFSENSCWRKL